ncbi:GNAT family N-acetyltransferase [Natrinema amylolyticum]|uniref:GNAT family N-acetyltransferase n=1 Tax=Natrinema amylolyticum TaxID=2878679 RepID=UPI001CFBE939|nr:GNAT family N-acetyltransferase [Natrinema amylolyticum]
MESALTLRRYRPNDGPRVRELHETAMRDADAYVEDVPGDLETVTETILEAGGEFLVGEVDDQIVAMGAFRPIDETDSVATFVPDRPESTVELTRLRVDPDYHRRGYGRRTYEELERRARSRDATQIVLDTMAKQTPARRLYESVGFEEVHRERIEAFDDPFELVIYRKSLTDSDA